MKRIGYLSHFTVSYLAGGGSSIDALTPKMQKETLNLFRSGKVSKLQIMTFLENLYDYSWIYKETSPIFFVDTIVIYY